MLRRGPRVKGDEVARRPQGKAVAVPAGRKILVDGLSIFIRKALEHPQDGVAPQAAKAAHPHRDAAVGQTLGQDGPLRRDDLLTVQAGGRGVQQQVHGKRGLVLFLGAAEHPAVVQQRGPPDPCGVEIAAAGNAGVWLLVHEDAVANLLGEAQNHAAVELPVFGVVGPVAVGLQLGLLGQMLCLRGGGLIGAGHARRKPEVAPEVVPGAELLLGLAQPLGRVEAAAKAALNVGAVLGGVLL